MLLLLLVLIAVVIGAVLFFFGQEKRIPVAPVLSPGPDTFCSPGPGPKFVTGVDDTLILSRGKTGPAAEEPCTVMQLFQNAVSKFAGEEALKVERPLTHWKVWTWQQYYDDVMTAARALIVLGYERHSCVNIIGFNSPEWIIGNMAAIAAGGKAAGIYTTNNPEACQYISEHSEGAVVLVENTTQLAKFLAVKGNLPKLKALVMWSGEVPSGASTDELPVYSWAEFMALGNGDNKAELQREVDSRIESQQPGDCCTLIYTSGTTGNPKAVMVSHDNCTWTASLIPVTFASWGKQPERIVSYLPLSHIAAQMVDVHTPIATAGKFGTNCTVYFARPDALKGTIGLTLAAARPTLFFGVPRVWEKIMEKMKAAGKKSKGLKKHIAAWARPIGLKAYFAGERGGSATLPGFYGLADKLVFSKVKQTLGLDQCNQFLTGAAPIHTDTLEFFGSLGVNILNLYGMSESSGPHSVSRNDYRKTGSCGPCLAGCELKLDCVPGRDKEGEGEICMRGRNVMMGYMKNEAKTREAIDDEGWLHSGDVGRLDEHNLLYITGRIKELLITAGGENIAPVPIENMLKKEAPALSNCMMVGDQRKFNNVLVTLKTIASPSGDGTYTNALADEALEVGTAKTVQEAMVDPAWTTYINDALKRVNEQVVSRASRVQKFTILPTDFSVPGGELGPTLKLKRPVVTKQYAQLIEDFYQ